MERYMKQNTMNPDHLRVVLLSGGMDSAALLVAQSGCWSSAVRGRRYEDSRRLYAVGFDYGQPHAAQELKAAQAIADPLNVPFLRMQLPNLTSQRIPGDIIWARNLIFASVAANVAQQTGGGEVMFGYCEEDQEGFPDCRPGFVAPLNKTLQAAELDVSVSAPHVNLAKGEVLSLYWNTPLFQEVMALSYSCYVGGEEPCGVCPACSKRRKAFRSVAQGDPAS